MAAARDRAGGRFWIAGSPEQTVGGWLGLSGDSRTVELAEPLTESMRELSPVEDPDGRVSTTLVPADDPIEPGSVVIHGMIRNGPQTVTLIDAVSVGRNQIILGRNRDPGEQRLRADYVVYGAHVDDRDDTFTKVRVGLRNLDWWARLPGIGGEIDIDGFRVTMTYEPHDQLSVALEEGVLYLDSVVTVPRVTLRRAGFSRTAELRWETTGAGLTIDQIWSRLVDPLRLLLTLAVGVDSPATSLKVWTSTDDRWLDVDHPGLAGDDPDPARDPAVLLTRDHLGLEEVARWLAKIPTLSPVPQLVAGVMAATSQRTLENQLLDLATAAEGLHRRLHPDQSVMNAVAAREVRHAARDAVPAEVKNRVSDALLHLSEPTYRERLQTLVDEGSAAVPGLVPAPDKWIGAIVGHRVGSAHQLASGSDGSGVRQLWALLNSLRWTLTALLLSEAGVSMTVLAEQLELYQPYLHLRRQCQRWLPPPEPGSTAQVLWWC